MKISSPPSLLAATLFALALALLALAFRSPVSTTPIRANNEHEPALQLSGAAAQEYLERPGDGESLMAALMAARFGLKYEEQAPFEEKSGAGYLGVSHDQNLSAWFGEEGVTVRPTVPEDGRAQAWQVAFRAKAYGYGEQLADVPPVTARNVKGIRIEYERQNQQSAIRNWSSGMRTGRKASSRVSRCTSGLSEAVQLGLRSRCG